MMNSQKSGAGASDVRKPTLWCFDNLAFLNCHTEIKESRSNIEVCTYNFFLIMKHTHAKAFFILLTGNFNQRKLLG